MKRFCALFLALVLLASLLPAASLAVTQYATVVGGWLRLRDGASFNAHTITSYNTGTQVRIIGTSGSWYKVETPDGRVGYMYSQYLNRIGGGTYLPGGDAYVTSHNGYGVRMRSGPSTAYRVIAKYDVGTPVTVLQRGSSWCEIRVNGRTGFMMTQFLRFGSGGGGGGGGSETVLCYANIWSYNGYGVRLRTGPGKEYDKIGVYSVGTTVAVLQKGAVWDRVRVGSRVGYMMNEFLNYHQNNELRAVAIAPLNPAVGDTMSVVAITPSAALVDYEWYVGGAVEGHDSTYKVRSEDLYKTIQLKVTGRNGYSGSVTSPVTSAVVGIDELQDAELNTKIATVGNTLTVTLTPKDAAVESFVWRRGTTQLSTTNSYTVRNSDVGEVIEVTVTGRGSSPKVIKLSTEPVLEKDSVEKVEIKNETTSIPEEAPAVGDTLVAEITPKLATVTYQWMRDNTPIPGATGKEYKIDEADKGSKIRVVVAGTGAYSETASLSSAATKTVEDAPGAPTLGGGSLGEHAVDVEYPGYTLQANGRVPITWSRTNGSLPNGLEMKTDGRIIGTPTEVGDFSFDVTATNAYGTSEAVTITIRIVEPPMGSMGAKSKRISSENSENTLKMLETSPWQGKAGEMGTFNLPEIVGGTAPINWTVSCEGIDFKVDGNTVTCEALPDVGEDTSYTVSLTVQDANGEEASGSLTLTVAAPKSDEAPASGGANPPDTKGDNPPAPGANNPPAPGSDDPPAPGGDNPPAPGSDNPPELSGDNPPAPGSDDPPAPSGDNPPAPGIDNPPAPGIDNPPAPGGDNSPVPGIDNPPAPGGDNPPAPGIDDPPALGGNNPPAPDIDNPPAQKGDNPPATGGDNPAAPKKDKPTSTKPLEIHDTPLPKGKAGKGYSHPLPKTKGGVEPIQWSVRSDSNELWLEIVDNTITCVALPNVTVDTSYTVYLTATDANGAEDSVTLTLKVTAPKLDAPTPPGETIPGGEELGDLGES